MVFVNERDGYARLFGPGSAAYPVYVVFGLARDIEIQDMAYVLDVDAAAQDIGSDQNRERLVLEAAQNLFTLFLLFV